jgi:hypothetical protein
VAPPKRPQIISPPEPLLARYAVEAKAHRKDEFEVSARYPEASIMVSPSAWLRSSTVVLAKPVRVAAAQTVLIDTIVTWHVFEAVETLNKPSVPAPWACSRWQPSTELRLEANEIAVPLEGGSALVDGVTIRILRHDSTTQFRLDEQYLLVGSTCSNQILPLPAVIDAVYRVQPGGTLSNTESVTYLAAFILSFGSVNGVRSYLVH